MQPSIEAAAAYVDAAAAALGLPLAPEHRPGVIETMARLLAMADLVTGLELPPEVEADAFRP